LEQGVGVGVDGDDVRTVGVVFQRRVDPVGEGKALFIWARRERETVLVETLFIIYINIYINIFYSSMLTAKYQTFQQ
jgi:hypothetical protein